MKNILIIGVVHGDEPQGEYFIKRFLKNHSVFKNNLYFIPRLNSAKTRKNPNGVDLNRNFPTQNWQQVNKDSEYYGGMAAGCELETKFLIELSCNIKFDAIITIHSPYKIINYDGPAEKLAIAACKFLDYPVQKDIGYPTKGSMGTYFGIERNIPILTIECDENAVMDILYFKFEKFFLYLANEF